MTGWLWLYRCPKCGRESVFMDGTLLEFYATCKCGTTMLRIRWVMKPSHA